MRSIWPVMALLFGAGILASPAQAGSANVSLATKYPANASHTLTTTYPALAHTATASLATSYPAQGGSSSSGTIVNPSLASNPAGWSTLNLYGQGATFSYESSDCSSTQLNHAADTSGDCPVYVNGKVTGYYAWQLGLGSDGNVYGYNLADTQWSKWNGTAFVLTGSGPDGMSTSPPIALLGKLTPTAYGGPGIPMQWGVFPGDGLDIPFTSAFGSPPPGGWISRIPDYPGRNPSGPTNFYTPLTFTEFSADPATISYDMNICSGGNQCTGSEQPDWAGLVAGTYDAEINSQIQTYLVPLGKNLFEADIDHEEFGSCWFVWQMFNCNSSGVPAATIVAGKQHLVSLLRQNMPWIKIGCESPGALNPTDQAYYVGNPYCDIIIQDDYRENYGTGDSDYTDWVGGQQSYIGSNYEFAAMNGFPFEEPEFADVSQPWNCTPPLNPNGGCSADTGNIASYYIEMYASTALSLGESSGAYWDGGDSAGDAYIGDTYNNSTGSNVQYGNIAPKEVALARAWPDGLYGTMYDPPAGAAIPLPSELSPNTVPFIPQTGGFWSMLEEWLWPSAEAAGAHYVFTPAPPDAAAYALRAVELQLQNPNLSAANKTILQARAAQLQAKLTAAQAAWITAHPVPSKFLH